MNRKRILVASLVIAVFALWSCGDESNPANGNNRVNSMPNAVGMIWKYEVYDSLTQTTDTVSVSITDAVVEGLRWRMFWHGAGSVVERVATVRGDTLDFIIDTNFVAPPLERFVFPLTLGSQWDVPPGFDSYEVVDTGNVTVPAGTFLNSVQIERIKIVDFERGNDKSLTWFTPNVGIVSRYFYSIGTDGGGNSFVTKNETWELIDYDLSTFSLNQFPGAVGSEWIYEIVGSRLNNPDTVIVSIADYPPIAGFDSTKMWLINGTMIMDTQFVAYVNNQVWVSEDTLMNALWDWRYEFPLAVGRHWGQVTIPEQSFPIVDAKTSVTTPAGIFPSAFHYTMSGGGFNSFWGVEDWLVPGVGVVKRTLTVQDFRPFGYTQEWTLLSYRLK